MQNSIMSNRYVACVFMALLVACACAHGVEEAVAERAGESSDYAAYQLLKRGEELLGSGESERGIRMLETVIAQNPTNNIRFRAQLDLGRHYVGEHEQAKAIEALGGIFSMKRKDAEGNDVELAGKDLDIYLEGVYLTGVAYFQSRRYSAAFSTFRQLTVNYPNTVWANQAYYYIGMSHYAQENWSKAIANLILVGTFIDPESPELEYVEAGQRFYVKIPDKDLAVLNMLQQEVSVAIETASGDRERLVCEPQMNDTTVYVGSIQTTVGKGTPGDGVLGVIGGDRIKVTYVDDSDQQGNKNIPRETEVKVVSTGTMTFTRGTYKFKADAAFLEQPVFIRIRDVDLDRSDAADTVKVRIASVYRADQEETEPTETVLMADLLKEKGQEFKTRDEVTLTLIEIGDAPVHTGTFTGSVLISRAADGEEPNAKDNVLACKVGDEIIATYIDELTIQGDTAVELTAKLPVLDEIDSAPKADQDVVTEAVIRARKEIVEAEAYLEIAKIFQSMGLKKGAKEKSDQGLERVDFAIRSTAAIPSSLREKAFSIKWNLHLAQEDFGAAMATCNSFNRLYPGSPLVDSALMGIAKIYLKRKDHEEAIRILGQLAGMSGSRAGAEAQFMIAETREKMNAKAGPSAGVSDYKLCAMRFPESEFAGPSLAKVLDYHIATKDYYEAENLLTQIFIDYQDENFLDAMMMKWVEVATAMGNYEKAREKGKQLLFEYPGSAYASKVTGMLEKIDEVLNKKEKNAEGAE